MKLRKPVSFDCNLRPLKLFSGLFLLVAFNCFADDSLIDELFSQAERYKVTNQVEFNRILSKLNDQQSELNNYQKDELKYLSVFNDINSGNFSDAVSELNVVFNQTQSEEIKVRSHLTLSNLHAFTGAYEKAFHSLKFVSENIETVKDSKLKNVIYYAMANTYLLTNQYDLSLKFSQLLLNQELDGWTRCLANTIHVSATIKNQLKTFAEAEIQEVYKSCVDQGQYPMGQFLRSIWISNQIKLMHKPYDFNLLQQYVDDLENENKQTDVRLLKSIELINLSIKAQIYWMLGDSTQAEYFAKMIVNSPATMGNNEPQIDALKVLKSLAVESENHELAYNYLTKLSEIETKFKLDNQMKQMAFMNVQHANLASELELEQVNKANHTLIIEQNLAQQKSLNQKLVVALLLVLVSLLFYILYRMKIRHEELESIAVMDHLTKVLNRKGFEVQLEEELEASHSIKFEAHLAILDFDHFKQVNDEHGHLTGDWILKHVIYEVKKHMDSKMTIGRLGGEEFGILGKEMTSKEMDFKIEQIRQSIEQLDCSDSGHKIKVTASFGVTSSELSGHTMQMMLAHADMALYQAKSRGRNQCVRYQYLN